MNGEPALWASTLLSFLGVLLLYIPSQQPQTVRSCPHIRAHTYPLKLFLLDLHCLCSCCSWFCHSLVMSVTEVSMKRPLALKWTMFCPFFILCSLLPYNPVLHFIWVLLLLHYTDVLGVLMGSFLNRQDESKDRPLRLPQHTTSSKPNTSMGPVISRFHLKTIIRI